MNEIILENDDLPIRTCMVCEKTKFFPKFFYREICRECSMKIEKANEMFTILPHEAHFLRVRTSTPIVP